jgi:hypothetical protein
MGKLLSLDLDSLKLGVSCTGAFYMICCMFWALPMHVLFLQFGSFKATCCSALGWMSNQLVLAPEHGKVQQYFYAFLQGLMWLLD